MVRLQKHQLNYTMDGNRAHMTSDSDVERILMGLRKLWKSLLTKNESSPFFEQKLCRTKLVRFLAWHLCHPCERVRHDALDLLCGATPRLGDKTDALLGGVDVFSLLGNGASMKAKMKVFHFFRGYARRTQDLENFLETFRRLGLESISEDIRLSCIHGTCIVLDEEDIGDTLFRIIFPPLVSALAAQDESRTVLRAAYRTLRRIHDLIGDERFYSLMQEVGPKACDIYTQCLVFEERDPYVNIDLLDLSRLIGEYMQKMVRMGLRKAFGVVNAHFLENIATARDSHKADEVGNFVSALKRSHWDDLIIERHILDLVKLSTAFLAYLDRQVQLFGLDILKELATRVGYYLAPHIFNLADVLRETISSDNTQVTIKAKRVLHKLMGSVHPQTVIWELLRGWEPNHKVPVLRLIEGELRCFPYFNFDLASLCATLASEIEDPDPEVRSASRDCVRLLLNIIRNSPVPTEEDKAVRLLMRNPAMNWETLMSVGISGRANNFLADSFQSECNTTAQSTPLSKSILVPDLSLNYSSRSFQGLCNEEKSNENTLESVPARKAHSTTHEENLMFQEGKSFVSRNCKSTSNFMKEENGKQVSDKNFAQERLFVMKQFNILDKVEDQLTFPSPIMPEQNGDNLLTTSSNTCEGMLPHCHDGGDGLQREYVYCFHDDKDVNEESDAKNERGDWNYFSAEDQFLSESDCTLISSSSYDPKEHNLDDISSGCQVQNLDSKQYNFNILRTSTPMTEVNIKELDEFEAYENELLEVVTPTWITIPCDDETGKISVTKNSPTTSVSVKSKESSTYKKSNSYRKDSNQIEDGKVTRVRSSNLIKDKIYKDPVTSKPDNFQGSFQSKERDSLGNITSKSDSMPQSLNKSSFSPPCKQNKPARLLKNMTCKGASKGSQLTSKAEDLCLSEYTNYQDDENESSVCSDSTTLNPLNFELADVPSDHMSPDEGFNASEDFTYENNEKEGETPTKDIEENHEDDRKDELRPDGSSERYVGKVEFSDENVEENFVVESPERRIASKSKNLTEIKQDPKPTKSFLKKGSKRPSTMSPNHGPSKGKEIPRTPQDSTFAQESVLRNGQRETNSNKKASTTKAKSTVTNKKRSASFPSKIVNSEQSSDDILEECGEEQVSPYSEGQFSKCPWRQELEFASKGAPPAWVKKLEKDVSNMQPFPSTEAAEKGLKKALEDLEGLPWRPKEAALGELVRFSLHHPSLLEEELGRVTSALCAELQNQKSSISGRAVVVAGLLFQAMGKRMENKLRAIVGALLKKSCNRTLAAHFQIVIKSLSRIVSSSNPHKVVMAFINEESSHANKASRETAAQFLCNLTETLGATGCLSGTSLPGPVIKCAANFVIDRSPLTRYCGKRMFQVLVKHPKFNKLKDHHLDVDTAHDLKTLIEFIREKGVDEEPLPINFIK
ncbi:hypothetical protein JTE90_011237 [Oedothorax gibbosus]|uniref:TOG array regulator of axonemal microtubules protein 1 n=1 Tax=Oedothorax gibbosus TaxID=931172 RepID=A0AAV6VYL2_9ARAC|nr:hypothetical protein JTE90_011237 [Oedothorax gibbosus]